MSENQIQDTSDTDAEQNKPKTISQSRPIKVGGLKLTKWLAEGAATLSGVFGSVLYNEQRIFSIWLLFILWVSVGLIGAISWTEATVSKHTAGPTPEAQEVLSNPVVASKHEASAPVPKIFLEDETIFVQNNKPALENCYVIEYHDGDFLGGSRSPFLRTGLYAYGPRKQPFSVGKFRVINESEEPVSDVKMVMGLRIWPNKTSSDTANGENAPILPWVVTIPKRIYKGPENAFQFYVISYSTKQPIDVFLPNVISGITSGISPVPIETHSLQGPVAGLQLGVNLMMFEPIKKKLHDKQTN